MLSSDKRDWLLTKEELARSRGGIGRANGEPFTIDNNVTPLIDGQNMMMSLLKDLLLASSDDTIHITAWRLDATQSLLPSESIEGGGESNAVFSLLRDAVRRGATCRVLLWLPSRILASVRSKNIRSASLLRQSGVEVLLDNRLPFAGSHHQKTAVISHRGTGVAYVGGIDLAADRWDTQHHDGDRR